MDAPVFGGKVNSTPATNMRRGVRSVTPAAAKDSARLNPRSLASLSCSLTCSLSPSGLHVGVT